MKNTNYNVLKLLHSELDNLWRIEKHYAADAKNAPCKCKDVLKILQTDMKKHIEALKKELEQHYKTDNLA